MKAWTTGPAPTGGGALFVVGLVICTTVVYHRRYPTEEATVTVNFAPASTEPTPAELVAEHGLPTEMLYLHEDLMTVNLSNINGARILAVLGFTPDGCDAAGECQAADFLGRVLLALAVEPEDEGHDGYALQAGEGDALAQALTAAGAAVYAAPRAAGTTQRQLEALRELAEFAIERGMIVAWA